MILYAVSTVDVPLLLVSHPPQQSILANLYMTQRGSAGSMWLILALFALAKVYDIASHLAKHRNRFYAHELNTDFSVDASFVGNESRFINHAGGSEANCRVQSMY